MPELPEVETVRQTLRQFVLNETIENIEVYYPKIIEDEIEVFKNKLIHSTIREIDRVGKYLIFLFDDVAFVSHLRMEGKYHIVDKDEKVNKHTHVAFYFKDKKLLYMDTRKFGRMKLVDRDKYKDELPLSKLGKEPFDIDYEELYKKLHETSLPIKSALLDQSIMCGIGNIYANEICFMMGIDPRAKASRLSKKRVEQLKQVSIDVLNRAIEAGGTTIHSFDSNGIHGLFQIQLNAHGQKVCPKCQGEIKKIMLNQRGTYYCPSCQKKRY